MSGLTNRHFFVLASLAAAPDVARAWRRQVEELVREGLAERCGIAGDDARPTEAGAAALARWLGRPPFAEDAVPMTPRMLEAFRLIADGIARGLPPSRRELRRSLGLRSVSEAQRLVDQLEERGAIRRVVGSARGLAVAAPRSLSAAPQ